MNEPNYEHHHHFYDEANLPDTLAHEHKYTNARLVHKGQIDMVYWDHDHDGYDCDEGGDDDNP